MDKALKKEEDALVESIRKKSIENNLLKNKNKYLKDLIGAKGKQIPKSLKKCSIELETKQNELKIIENQIDEADDMINAMKKDVREMQNKYEEEKLSFNVRIELLDKKEDKKIKEVEIAFNQLLEKQEKQMSDNHISITKLKKQESILINSNQSLTNENMVTKNENTKLKKDNKTLENKKKVTEEESILEDKKAEIIKQDIKALEKKRKELTVDVKELTEEEEDEQKKLDRVLRNADFLVRKEDNLKSYEAYIIDIAKRLGLDYQPFK